MFTLQGYVGKFRKGTANIVGGMFSDRLIGIRSPNQNSRNIIFLVKKAYFIYLSRAIFIYISGLLHLSNGRC